MSQAGSLTGAISPSVATSYVTDDGTAVPSSNVLDILGGTDITVSGSGNTVLISYTGSSAGLVWNAVSGNTNMAVGNGYVIQTSSGVTSMTLPTVASSTFGNIVAIDCYTNQGFQVNQNAGNQILFGTSETTSGVSGSIQTVTGALSYSSLTLVCVYNDGTSGVWAMYGAPQGNYIVN